MKGHLLIHVLSASVASYLSSSAPQPYRLHPPDQPVVAGNQCVPSAREAQHRRVEQSTTGSHARSIASKPYARPPDHIYMFANDCGMLKHIQSIHRYSPGSG